MCGNDPHVLTHKYIYVYIHIYILYTHMKGRAHTYLYVQYNVHTYTWLQPVGYTCTRILHTNAYIIHTYTHIICKHIIHANTHIHIYAYTHTLYRQMRKLGTHNKKTQEKQNNELSFTLDCGENARPVHPVFMIMTPMYSHANKYVYMCVFLRAFQIKYSLNRSIFFGACCVHVFLLAFLCACFFTCVCFLRS